MYIRLCFDVHERIVYIPDGYINDLEELQNDFLDFVHNNPDCMVKIGNHYGYSYNEDDFLTYVNSFVITGKEKSYFIDSTESKNIKFKKLNF